ncbi:MAG: MBL fold metallo-hydrolase [Proteobacteria bacterium]|nr:MBL fold metallo-hydrolase [Pseudomonadota bacterium]
MIFGETGYVGKGLYVLGLPWTPSYLLDCSRPVLFEAGFSCVGRLYEEDIRKFLKERKPEMLFLTHVHYDHCGAVAYFKKVFPGIKVAASSRAAEIIKRPNAQKLMKDLSSNIIPRVAAVNGINPNKLLYEPFKPFEVDVILENGQVIQLTEDISVEVISTAGHTRDQLSYYIPERKILFATESVGNLDRIGQIIPEFLVDFELYITNIKRLSLLDVEVLCLGHQFVVLNSDVKEFFSQVKGREAVD